MDDRYDDYDEVDDSWYDEMYAQFHRDHAHEIADELTTNEIVSAILEAHRKWWLPAEAELVKARKRLDEGEYEEALYHAARAFDGYIKNVLIIPLKAVVVERFERSMPTGFPLKQDDIFKSVSGVGGGVSFAEYAVSLLTTKSEEAKTIIRTFHAFVKPGTGSPTWRERDRALHAPIDVSKETARALIDSADRILGLILPHMARLVADDDRERERREFSASRIETLYALARLYDRDTNAAVEGHTIPLSYDAQQEGEDTLSVLVALGHAQRVDPPDRGFGVYGRQYEYRLTPQGRAYYEQQIVPRLPDRLRPQPGSAPS